MKKLIQNLFIAPACLLLLATCGPTITTTKTANVDLDKYQTYAWLPNGDSIDNHRYNGEQLNQAIVSEVNQEMQLKGYTLDRTDPDLLVLVHTMFDKETNIVREPVYATYDYYAPNIYIDPYYNDYYYYDYNTVTRVVGYDVDRVQYTEGTLVIDLIDQNTNNVVWRGRADDYIEPYNVRAEVQEYVEEIFEEYPA
ncbi:DUF4136 domain-containing protein [Fulvivirga ulvae]|uniref:DUF4136 domain-containing protein n=1 Tax=Fulvivirga ulvae TaxID=2904245 RepID=UPI001F364D0C|nr:DUF4136 domain-containing protein [Fulvivirga ulvae]UII32924.1 DUF4136 domain-containing protein [Fulvivirga ulvae]